MRRKKSKTKDIEIDFDNFDLIDFKNLSLEELEFIAVKVREKIIKLSKSKAIHLASNLGIVELSMALLYCFDSPNDKIVYDTGHQSYTHKLLTGRWKTFETIRDDNGLSGFQEPEESIHDLISTGHSGNILSFCQAVMESNKFNNFIVPVVGDAALANGLSFEALNNISFNKDKMIIVINDNEMSISKNVGALNELMGNVKLSKFFFFSERAIKKALGWSKFTSKIYSLIYKTYNFFENILVSKNFFQNFGFIYIGPVDGHNFKHLIKAIKKAKWYSRQSPVILHVKTQKGKGLSKAVEDKIGYYHSASLSETNNTSKDLTYGDVAAKFLCEKARLQDFKVLNCGMTLSTGFQNFSTSFPKMYEDLGISEEHAVSKSAGFAYVDKKTIVVMYSTFLQRTYDQILHDISRLALPVIFLIDRADIAYGDGNTHHGIYDVGFLKTIPNTIITSPSNQLELKTLLLHAFENKQNPFFIRYGKDVCPIVKDQNSENELFLFGEWKYLIKQNASILIISYGNFINDIKKAIVSSNKKIDLINAIYISNFDQKKVVKILKKYKKVFVIEKVYFQNNLYSEIVKLCFENNLNIEIKDYSIKNNAIGFGSKKTIDKKLEIDPNLIIDQI